MADRPNFYELLGLDPEKDVDWKMIEERIEAKRRDWARDVQSNPKRRQEAKRNMDLLPEIRKVLSDTASGCREAEEARRLRREARQTREIELVDWIELLKASGRCRPEQFEKLCSQFAEAFSAAEIRQRLVNAGVRVVEPRTWERTDSSIAKDIRDKLGMLKLPSLYEFLGLPRNSPAEALRAKAEAIYKENLNLGRTDATASAQNGLVGPAKLVFGSEEEKRKYDNEIILSAFESLEDQIDVAGTDGVLSAQEFELLVRLAVQRGVPETDALDLLEERAVKEGWRVEASPSGPSPAPDASPAAGPAPGETEDAEPPAPSRLNIQAISGGLRLSWDPVPLPGVRYRVLRKASSVSGDEGDGEVVATTGQTRADDFAVPPAVPWYYAVFSLKNGLASRVPAHSGPHLIVTPGTAGASRPSRSMGRLPIRSIAAGLTLLTLGGGTAFFMGLPPFPARSATKAISVPQGPSSSPIGGQSGVSGTAPGPGNVAPSPPSATSGTNPSQTASANMGNAGNSTIVPVLPPSPGKNPQVPSPGAGSTSGSGHNSASTSVLGVSVTRSALVSPPPPPSSTIPANPEVAVIAVGDPLLAAPLEDELASALRDQGIGVLSGSPTLEDLRRHRSNEPSVSEILASLQGDGVHAVVIAQVDRLADRELQYYGRKDVVSTSRVRIHAYLVNGRRALGSGWSDQIEYNAVSATSEGEGAARRAVSGLADAVRSGWSSLLSSATANP
jgi:hypothetical protein